MTRHLPRFFIHVSALVLVLAGAAVAIATNSGGKSPPPEKPLAAAIGDALAGPAPAGVSGRFEFTNRLVDSAAAPAGSPLLAGAEGRFWLARDGRARLELQSRAGNAQILLDDDRLTVYEPASDTVYRVALPAAGRAAEGLRSGAGIQSTLGRLARGAVVSGAQPGTVAGEQAYTVRIAPRHDGGLLGAAELAWHADHGVPLRAAVYAQGEREPVLEIGAKDVRFGPVDDGVFAISQPKGARVVEIGAQPGGKAARDRMGHAASFGAVQRRLSFPLAAPDSVAGLPRRSIRTVTTDGRTGALVTYGKGLGALTVLQVPAGSSPLGELPGLQRLSIGGATARELPTALGTLVQFERDGVAYLVAGSVPPAAAEAAARAL